MKRDILFAAAFLILGVLGAMEAYQSTILRERPETPFDKIPVGERRYELRSFKTCFGALEFQSGFDDSYELKLDGLIRLKFQAREIPATVQMHGFFNALGQLGSAYIRVRALERQVTVGFEDVNPFKLSLRVKDETGEESVLFSKYFPGPVELIEEGSEFYRVQYRYLPKVQSSELQLEKHPFVQSLGLSLVETVEGEGSDCSSSLDLSLFEPLIKNLDPQGLSALGGLR